MRVRDRERVLNVELCPKLNVSTSGRSSDWPRSPPSAGTRRCSSIGRRRSGIGASRSGRFRTKSEWLRWWTSRRLVGWPLSFTWVWISKPVNVFFHSCMSRYLSQYLFALRGNGGRWVALVASSSHRQNLTRLPWVRIPRDAVFLYLLLSRLFILILICRVSLTGPSRRCLSIREEKWDPSTKIHACLCCQVESMLKFG